MSTNLYILIQILICDRGNGAVTNKISRCQCEEITRLKLCLSTLKIAGTNLRSFCVEQNCDWKSKLRTQLLDHVHTFLLFFVCTVRKIQSCHIHSGKHKLPQYILVIRCRSQRTNNLCLSHHLLPRFIFICQIFSHFDIHP